MRFGIQGWPTSSTSSVILIMILIPLVRLRRSIKRLALELRRAIPVRRQRLGVVLIVVIFSSLAIGLVMRVRGNINLFYPPSRVLLELHQGKAIRVGEICKTKVSKVLIACR